MTIIVPIDEAKAMLAELCARARDGEEVVLTENGTPVGRLLQPTGQSTPIAAGKRPLGLFRDKVRVHDDFNDPLPDFEESFYCGS